MYLTVNWCYSYWWSPSAHVWLRAVSRHGRIHACQSRLHGGEVSCASSRVLTQPVNMNKIINETATRWLIMKCFWNGDSCPCCRLTVCDSSPLCASAHKLFSNISSHLIPLISCMWTSRLWKSFFHCPARSLTIMPSGIWKTSTLWTMTQTYFAVGRILIIFCSWFVFHWQVEDAAFTLPTCHCLSALKLAVVDIYHSRLKERQRRKK